MVKSYNVEKSSQRKTSGPNGHTVHWRHTKSDRKKTVHVRWSAHRGTYMATSVWASNRRNLAKTSERNGPITRNTWVSRSWGEQVFWNKEDHEDFRSTTPADGHT